MRLDGKPRPVPGAREVLVVVKASGIGPWDRLACYYNKRGFPRAAAAAGRQSRLNGADDHRRRASHAFSAATRREGAGGPGQVAAIAASIKEWGWTSPALVGEDGGLIAGHARILAAR